jgi:hypothetical protein
MRRSGDFPAAHHLLTRDPETSSAVFHDICIKVKVLTELHFLDADF